MQRERRQDLNRRAARVVTQQHGGHASGQVAELVGDARRANSGDGHDSTTL